MKIGQMTIWAFLKFLHFMLWRPLRAGLRWWLYPSEMEQARLQWVQPVGAVDGSSTFDDQLKTTWPRVAEFVAQAALFFHANAGPNRVSVTFWDSSSGEILETVVRRRRGLTETEIADRMRAALRAIAESSNVAAMDSLELPPVKLAQMGLQMCGWGDQEPIEVKPIQRLEARSISQALHEFLVAYELYSLRVRAERSRDRERLAS